MSFRPSPIPPDQAVSNIGLDIVLCLVTCGIYNLFWIYRQFRTINSFLGREEYNFGMWFLLTIVTCGIYHIYIEYKFATSINDVQRAIGRPVNDSLPLITLLLSFFGFTIVADAIQQNEINMLYGQG